MTTTATETPTGATGAPASPEKSNNRLVTSDTIAGRIRKGSARMAKEFATKMRILKPTLDSHAVLDQIADQVPKHPKPRGAIKQFLRRDRMNDSDTNFALAHMDAVTAREKSITAEFRSKNNVWDELSPRRKRGLYVEAVRQEQAADRDEIIGQAQEQRGEILQQIEATRNSPLFGDVVKAEIRERQVARKGKEPGRVEQYRIKKDLLEKAVKGEQTKAAADVVAAAEASTQAAAEAEQVQAAQEQEQIEAVADEKAGFRGHKDYREKYLEAYKSLIPNGLVDSANQPLSESAVLDLKNQADEAAVEILKSQYPKDKQLVLDSGDYHRVFDALIDRNPALAKNPNLDRIITFEAMKQREERLRDPDSDETPAVDRATADHPVVEATVASTTASATTAESGSPTPPDGKPESTEATVEEKPGSNKEFLESIGVKTEEGGKGAEILKLMDQDDEAAKEATTDLLDATARMKYFADVNKLRGKTYNTKELFEQSLDSITANLRAQIKEATDTGDSAGAARKGKIWDILRLLYDIGIDIASEALVDVLKKA